MTAETAGRLRVLVFPTETADVAYLRYVPWDLSTMLETLEGLIGGGGLERLDITDEAHIYLDVEGKHKGLQVNTAANRIVFLANPGLRPNDFMAGPVIVLGSLDADGDDDGYEHDVPDSAVELCRRAGVRVVDETAAA